MFAINIRLQKELEPPFEKLEEKRWQDTLQSLESVRQGKILNGDKVHKWLESWGTENELDAPKL